MSVPASTSAATAADADADAHRPSTSDDPAHASFPPSSFMAVPFSAGNSRIEETRGVLNLIPEDTFSPRTLPAWRKPLLCVLEVPNHMTYADFCMFCGSFIQHVLDMRIVRNEQVEDRYSVLLTFDNQDSADGFYKHFNRKSFSSMEENVCRVFFTVDVQYTLSVEHRQRSIANSMELASCAVCLERLDQDTGGVLTTICNHSFHCSCISKWADSSCPVCRYQQQPEKSTCNICQTSENLWMCVICGFVGCGRFKEGHAIRHWKETQHCYSLELETQRVWDYAGDNYVHRLIQSKTDGKLVELNSHTDESCKCDSDGGMSEALFNSKVENIFDEYNDLLTSQLENQRKYFESHLQEVKEEIEYKTSEAIMKLENLRLQKMQAKLNEYMEEKKFLADINDNLIRNQEMWKTKIQEAEKREGTLIRLVDDKIQALEKQLGDLMVGLEPTIPISN